MTRESVAPDIVRNRSSYAPAAVGIGIVHLGLGAFHRAHQAAYVERWLERNGGGEWGICAANIRSNADLVRQMTAQDCRYHVAAYESRGRVAVSEIHAIRRAVFARDDPVLLLEQMTAPNTRIVSLTVTEKGYYLRPSTGELRLDDAAIVHDIEHPHTPGTAPGLILEALLRRRALGIPPFTVLSCDNMPDNGARTRRAVASLAALRSHALAEWIETEVAFPSCMVDRIVPAVSGETAVRLRSLIGFADPAAVACEAFSQWVIEDRFSAGRPDWETVGVEMVGDVAPFETMKLRLLNGAHSLLAYAGFLRGKKTVHEAMLDPALEALVFAYCDEAARSLEPAPGTDPKAYTRGLADRFRNDALEHSLSQIAMDGSQKIPQRWLAGARVNLEHGNGISATAGAVAAWMAYVRGRDRKGRTWEVDDPMASRLAACHAAHSADAVDALLGIGAVFPRALAGHGAFRAAILEAYMALVNAEATV